MTVTASHARAGIYIYIYLYLYYVHSSIDTFLGDLQIVLRSPSGTQSVLADVHAYFPVLTFDGENGYLLGTVLVTCGI